jgi:hypothetical protein
MTVACQLLDKPPHQNLSTSRRLKEEQQLPFKMKAVVFKGPLSVALEERPIPQIQDPTDVILKVRYTALCGR